MAKKLDYGYCKAAPMLEWIGNKWTLVVLLKVAESNGTIRFSELYRTIPSLSEKVLAAVLRQLCADGLLERRLYADVPPRTEYSVTEFGRTLLPHVQGLIEWGRENFDTIMHNRARLHRDSMKDIEGGKGR
ncbi:helix-turn-helix transcriptional regulator [Prevotella sp. PCHR]|uniref:Helix-turn-helix transcriptional regulator n=1 Tax=Xylanibacter caecicola TaxID=2736294 RepID=A0ABX2B391_9BACT|nr:helix-turn-helix domain-containing protein [Xylanibacter caecicola]NPE25753.1 helix-turn-helix transcriptional regulator [Xylanibacter caecicola]